MTCICPVRGKIKLNSGAPGWNYLSQGLDRKQISYSGHYDIAPSVTFVSEAFFTDRDSDTSLRPEPLLGDSIATSIYPGFFIPSFAPGYPTGVEGPYGFAAFLTPDQYGPRAIIRIHRPTASAMASRAPSISAERNTTGKPVTSTSTTARLSSPATKATSSTWRS
ncbi:MAG: hypothetical protein WDM77_12605 [Steroidobacteraceae bacterium]